MRKARPRRSELRSEPTQRRQTPRSPGNRPTDRLKRIRRVENAIVIEVEVMTQCFNDGLLSRLDTVKMERL
jgi:hypothetical protein